MSLTDEEWREVEQDIPSINDPFLQKYINGREQLINEEKTSRADAIFRDSLTHMGNRACKIVDAIREKEKQTIWTSKAEEEIAQASQECIFPGMMFMLAKERMESTKLWEIVRRMPKGCLLHAHMDAMVDMEYLINEMFRLPNYHMSSDRSLITEEDKENADLEFRYRKEIEYDGSHGSPWQSDYVPSTFLPIEEVADAYPDGGRPGFVKWLKGRCTLSLTDSHQQHHGIDAIWEKFTKCFLVVSSILHYEPMFRSYLRRLMLVLKEDGVNWAELRFTWPLNYCRDQEEVPEENYAHMFQVLEEEVAHFKASPAGKGFWGLTTIWTSLRSTPTRSIVESMDHCIATKMAFPHLIAGYDLVGPEDWGRPLVDLLPELFWFRKQCAQEGVNLPFFFHAGETLGDGSSTDNNLFDAVLLGTRRIGHAYSLFKHPLLIEMIKEKRILVESCPISNEVLRLCSSVLAHPLPALLARGVPCSLCNDDPAMLGQDTAGMSHDFWQALQGWDNLGLAGLGSLAENSIRWAAFEDENQQEWLRGIKNGIAGDTIKGKRLEEWQREWEKFCLWIVDTYGDEFDPQEETAATAPAI